MWRSFFMAVGIYCFLLGLECLALDKVIVSVRDRESGARALAGAVPILKEVVPPDFAPWSLMSAGAVIVLYSFTIPGRVKG